MGSAAHMLLNQPNDVLIDFEHRAIGCCKIMKEVNAPAFTNLELLEITYSVHSKEVRRHKSLAEGFCLFGFTIKTGSAFG